MTSRLKEGEILNGLKELGGQKKASLSWKKKLCEKDADLILKELPFLELRKIHDDLQYLCAHFDPYVSLEEVSLESASLLQELGIDWKRENPFTMTNKLLVLLDKVTNLYQELSENTSVDCSEWGREMREEEVSEKRDSNTELKDLTEEKRYDEIQTKASEDCLAKNQEQTLQRNSKRSKGRRKERSQSRRKGRKIH